MTDGTSDPDPDAGSGRDLSSIRASDGEREATAEHLRRSFSDGRLTLAEFDERTTRAYGAVFRSDLDELIRDLAPVHRPPHPAEPRPPLPRPTDNRPEPRYESPPVQRVSGEAGPAASVAIMGGTARSGPWTVPEKHTAVLVMGGGELDLTRASLQSHEVTIRVFAFMGGIEIVVPDDLHLDVDGIGFMGYFGEDTDDADDAHLVRQPPPGAPRVRVTGLAVWAGVSVRRAPRE